MSDQDQEALSIIEELLNTKTREAITEYIDGYGDAIDWSDYTTEQILREVWRSDVAAGEVENGILASMAMELL
jgi:hypothetical protein